MFRLATRHVALPLLLAAAPSVAAAESFVVSSGSALVTQTGQGLTLTASLQSSDDVSITLRWLNPEAVPCAFVPCHPGDVIRLNTDVGETIINVPPAENAAVGTATINGVTHAGLAFGGELSFAGESSFTLPVPAGGPQDFPIPLTLSGPFSFTGTLLGYRVLDVREPQLLFTLPLSGRGTATAVLLGQSPTNYTLSEMRYEFEPIPEPASVLLVGTGLVTALAARRRRRT